MTKRCSCNPGSRWVCSAARVGAASVDRQLQPWPSGVTGRSSAGSRLSADDVWSDDAGSWIYIGTRGLAGDIRSFAEIARRKFGGTLAGTVTPDRRPRGMAVPRRWRHDERRRRAVHDVDARRGRTAGRDALPGRGGSRSRMPLLVPACPRRQAAVSVGWWQRGHPLAEVAGYGFPRRHRHRPDQRSRSAQLRTATSRRRQRPNWLPRSEGAHPRARESMATHCRAMVALLDKGSEVFDYGTACARSEAGWLRSGVRLSRRSCLPTSAHCSARARPLPMGRVVR